MQNQRVTTLQFAADNNLSVRFVNLEIMEFYNLILGPKLKTLTGIRKKTEANREDIARLKNAIGRNYRKPTRSVWLKEQIHMRFTWEFDVSLTVRYSSVESTLANCLIKKAEKLKASPLTSGGIVEALRLRLNKSQAEVGELLGIYEDNLPQSVVSGISSGRVRERGQPFSGEYIDWVENDRVSISGQRLNNFMTTLEASTLEMEAITRWRARPRLSQLEEASSYADCLNAAIRLGWMNIREFVKDHNCNYKPDEQLTEKEVRRVLCQEKLPSVEFDRRCRLSFARKGLGEVFEKSMKNLADNSRRFFFNEMQTCYNLSEFIILCRLSTGLNPQEFAAKSNLGQHATLCAWESGSRAPEKKEAILNMTLFAQLPIGLAERLRLLAKEKNRIPKDLRKDSVVREEIDALKFSKQINSRHIFLPTSKEALQQAGKRSERGVVKF